MSIVINSTVNSQKNFRYLTLLISLVITLFMITAITQNRLVSLASINVCAAIFIYPFSYILLDVITEIYGYKVARQIIWCGILAWLLSGLVITLVIYLPSPPFWASYIDAFKLTMSPYLRSVISGTVAVIAGQFVNIFLISKLKILTKGRFFWIRSLASCCIGDIITIFIAIFFIFVGRMNFHTILLIATAEFVISILIQAIFNTPIALLLPFIKKSENMDAFDEEINFNPFSLKTDR